MKHSKVNHISDNGAVSWARFRGVSALYCRGDSDLGAPDPDGNRALRVDVRDEPLSAALAEGIARISQDIGVDRIAVLPRSSYHVTCLDGVNVANIAIFRNETRNQWAARLAALPSTLDLISQELVPPRLGDTVRFRYSHLEIVDRDGAALVAQLAPADRASAAALKDLDEQRAAIQRDWFARWGRPVVRQLREHVSLAYCSQQATARLAERLPPYDEMIRELAGEQQVVFTEARLFAFDSMAEFYTH